VSRARPPETHSKTPVRRILPRRGSGKKVRSFRPDKRGEKAVCVALHNIM